VLYAQVTLELFWSPTCEDHSFSFKKKKYCGKSLAGCPQTSIDCRLEPTSRSPIDCCRSANNYKQIFSGWRQDFGLFWSAWRLTVLHITRWCLVFADQVLIICHLPTITGPLLTNVDKWLAILKRLAETNRQTRGNQLTTHR